MLDSPPLGCVAQVQNLLRLFNDAGRACVVDKEVQEETKDVSMTPTATNLPPQAIGGVINQMPVVTCRD